MRIKVLSAFLFIFLQAVSGFAADLQAEISQTERPESGTIQPSPGKVDSPASVTPEVPSLVELSSSDINRLVCPVEIKDVIYSKEKGLVVKIAGRNAFVKFAIKKEAEKEIYSATPTELYVVCGEKVFNLIAVPKRIPSKTVMLSGEGNKATQNISLFSGMPSEKKILGVIRNVYTENIPDSFTIREANKSFDLFKGLRVTLRRTISVEGEGILVKEFVIQAAESMELQEKDFLRNDITTNPIAVSIDRLKLSNGEKARVIIAERVSDKGGI